MRVVRIVAVIVAASALLPFHASSAGAGVGEIVEFGVAAASCTSITAGPDGNLWFVEQGSEYVGRMTTSGATTKFAASAGSGPASIVAGPDGNLWFTEVFGDRIGRITPAGVVTEFAVAPGVEPRGITAGPDGNLWFTEQSGNRIGRITVEGTITRFAIPTADARPRDIVAAADGNLWFAEENAAQIGRITTEGVITEFSTFANGNIGIAAGTDDALWFTSIGGNSIGRITTSGAVTQYPLPTPDSAPIGIVAAADGNLWFTEGQANKVGRITTGGVIEEYSVPTANSRPFGITAGPDQAVWFTEFFAGRIGRVEITLPPQVYNVATSSRAASGNAIVTATLAAASARAGDTLIVAVATGTFAGPVGCVDSGGNAYTVVADRNTGNGRMFVCSAHLTAALTPGDTISATYPGFSGVSVISANVATSVVAVDQTSISSGNTNSPNSGSVTTSSGHELVFGVIAHNSTPTFAPGAGFTTVGAASGGSGSGMRTLSPEFRFVTTAGAYAAHGSLSSGQQWRAAVVTYRLS